MTTSELPGISGLTCRASTHLVSEGRDRLLTAEEVARLHQHIESCPACQVASRQFADLFGLVDCLFGKEPHADAA